MTTVSLIEQLRQHLRGLRTACTANVTATFALAMVPMAGFIGAVVDYSHSSGVRTSIQAAVDSTALMLSKEATSLTIAQMQTKASDYFKALVTRGDAQNPALTLNYTNVGGSQISVVGSATVKTSFMAVMGLPSINVSAMTLVKWGNTRLRVALVLDNTGSMSGSGKMTALKTATVGLLDQLNAAAVNNGDVYVSIIPFVKDVNVGSSNYQATWIDWTEWDAKNGKCSDNDYKSKNSCLSHNKTWTPKNHNTWNGCVVDRGDTGAPSADNYDTLATTPDTTKLASLFSAEQYDSCPQAVMPLSYDWPAMKLLVNNMSPDGMTNQGIGLAHGWMSLVGGGPYPQPPAEDPKYKYSKVIILMSDGLNTQNRWYSSASSIDARQKIACNNVKAAGITLYTIHVNTDGDPMSTLLKDCASGTDKFWMLTSADQMVATFQQIGTALSNLRIVQ